MDINDPLLSNVKITIIENEDLKDEKVRRENLIHFYDVFNKAVNELNLSEEEKNNFFLSDEELKEMEKSGKYKFI